MPTYRILALCSDRKIQSVKDIDCENDEVATDQTRQLVDGHDVELWQQGRFVDFFKSPKKRPPAYKRVYPAQRSKAWLIQKAPSPMSKSSEYLRNEMEWRALASAAKDESERASWLQLAEKWLRLRIDAEGRPPDPTPPP